MVENHYLEFLPHGKNSSAYLSYYVPENLIIFVHGFGGHASKTWNEFSKVVRTSQDFRYSDIIFYGYNSLRHQINSSANLFYHDLSEFAREYVRNSDPRKTLSPKNTIAYKRIILVGHSMGAVVIRKALLIANFNEAAWLKKTQMVLFAPAHRGAYPRTLALAALQFPLSLVAWMAHLRYPALHDVDINSTAILELKTETDKLILEGKGAFTAAKNVFYIPGDPVVQTGPFGIDKTEWPVEGKNHISICKPQLSDYFDPIDAILTTMKSEL